MELEDALEYKPLFGKKHPGKTLHDIAMADPLYIDWFAGLKDIRSTRMREAVRLVAEEFADDIERALAEREDE